MTVKAKKNAHPGGLATKRRKRLGRSALTGTRVLAPASKGASVSVHQVRRALATLNSHATK